MSVLFSGEGVGLVENRLYCLGVETSRRFGDFLILLLLFEWCSDNDEGVVESGVPAAA